MSHEKFSLGPQEVNSLDELALYITDFFENDEDPPPIPPG